MKDSSARPNKTSKKNAPPPDRGDPLYEEVRVVRDRVEEVLGVMTYIAHDPELVRRQEDSIRSYFKKNRALARVYLALSPDRNITQLAAVLNVRKQSVHESIQKLAKVNPRVIMKMNAGGGGDVWIPNPTLEDLLHLSSKLRQWLPDLEAGSPAKVGANAEPTTMEAATERTDLEQTKDEPTTEATE